MFPYNGYDTSQPVAPLRARELKLIYLATYAALSVAPLRARELKCNDEEQRLWRLIVAPLRARELKSAQHNVLVARLPSRPYGRVS